jgi:hypothetical protein
LANIKKGSGTVAVLYGHVALQRTLVGLHVDGLRPIIQVNLAHLIWLLNSERERERKRKRKKAQKVLGTNVNMHLYKCIVNFREPHHTT